MKSQKMYAVTGFFRNYETEHYTEPSETFYSETREAAEQLKHDMELDPVYDTVWINDEPQEVEI